MLKYRSLGIIILILALPVVLLMIFRPEAAWLLIPLAATWLSLLIIGSARICSQFYLPAFCKSRTAKKVVALTFDDGPDLRITPEIMNILDNWEVKATFFLIGKKVNSFPDLAAQIVAKGHTVGIHSYSHAFWFDLFGRKKMERDLQEAQDIIRAATGVSTDLFRPPYGVTNPVLAKVVKKLKWKVIGWSVRSLDTTCSDSSRIADRVIRGLHPGAVILMHDTKELTPGAVEMIIARAKEKGYQFVGLEEMLNFSQ